ncbi:hypothetical protein PS833_04840 [Pseudomonas fluorescens]|uniref:Uncharacterized protein n=1 Tax=Pseudomonas fluorescens TaxID=294 RepID=A0A5E7ETS3_PSEFL|nr:hypothetical protein PS833_04840 [Pseudomonas fluorescens]
MWGMRAFKCHFVFPTNIIIANVILIEKQLQLSRFLKKFIILGVTQILRRRVKIFEPRNWRMECHLLQSWILGWR